jgi:hypothetical protein
MCIDLYEKGSIRPAVNCVFLILLFKNILLEPSFDPVGPIVNCCQLGLKLAVVYGLSYSYNPLGIVLAVVHDRKKANC